MSIAPEALLEQALALPPADRFRLASSLLASVDGEEVDPDEVERLWSVETDRRMTLLESGEANLTTWEHLTERIDGLRTASAAE